MDDFEVRRMNLAVVALRQAEDALGRLREQLAVIEQRVSTAYAAASCSLGELEKRAQEEDGE